MKTCDEMVNSLLKRREQYFLEQKQKRRKTAVKIAVSGCYCALAAVIGTGIRHSVISSNKISGNSSVISGNSFQANSEPENITPPELDRSSVIWAGSDADDNVNIADELVNAVEGAFDEFNGKVITKTLSEALKEHGDESIFAVGVFYFPYCTETEAENFIYNGKTLAEYEEDAIIKCFRSMDLSYIRNNAEYLKYGEEYYKTNTVTIDGVPWTKYDYDHAVELVGEEFISKYFVDGEFLEDEFSRVRETVSEEYRAAEDAYEEAHNAWKTSRLEKETERFTSMGINCELRTDPELLVIFVTKDELSELAFDRDSGRWVFGLARENDRDVLGWLIDE